MKSQLKMRNMLLQTGWRRGDPCDKMAKSLAELCSLVLLWKAELVKMKLGIWLKLCKQSAEGEAWLLLKLTVKCKNRNKDGIVKSKGKQRFNLNLKVGKFSVYPYCKK